jgi:hypothetical protein
MIFSSERRKRNLRAFVEDRSLHDRPSRYPHMKRSGRLFFDSTPTAAFYPFRKWARDVISRVAQAFLSDCDADTTKRNAADRPRRKA